MHAIVAVFISFSWFVLMFLLRHLSRTAFHHFQANKKKEENPARLVQALPRPLV